MLEGIKAMINHAKEKGIATLIVIAAVASVVLVAGIVSQKWLGADNQVEESAESFLEQEGEDALDLPDGSLKGKLDLSPSTPEKNKK